MKVIQGSRWRGAFTLSRSVDEDNDGQQTDQWRQKGG